MEIKILKLGYLQTNCYLLVSDNKVVLIDPADDFNIIKDNLNGLKLVGVIVTHHHPDHIGALKSILNEYDIKLYDFYNLKEGLNEIDIFKFKIIYTPGHTNDSITIYFEKEGIMFVGDFIFKDTIGRTDLPTGNYSQMLSSISKIKQYQNIKIYPGHGVSTTLEYEKKYNQFFK